MDDVNPTSGFLGEMKTINHITIMMSFIKTQVLKLLNDSLLSYDMKTVLSHVLTGINTSQSS